MVYCYPFFAFLLKQKCQAKVAIQYLYFQPKNDKIEKD